jgi:hypothetical protein
MLSPIPILPDAARRAQKWKPVLRDMARQNYELIIGRDSEIAPDDPADAMHNALR